MNGGWFVTSTPWRRTRPDVGSSNPAIIRRVVVLPEPDGPSIEKNSPSRTSRSIPSTATTVLAPAVPAPVAATRRPTAPSNAFVSDSRRTAGTAAVEAAGRSATATGMSVVKRSSSSVGRLRPTARDGPARLPRTSDAALCGGPLTGVKTGLLAVAWSERAGGRVPCVRYVRNTSSQPFTQGLSGAVAERDPATLDPNPRSALGR